MLQIFANLHGIFANQHLYHVDNDNIRICQVHHVAKKTTDRLGSDNIKTKQGDHFLNNLATDEVQNITAEFWTKGANHNVTLNAIIAGRGSSLVNVKEACLKVKTEILKCMIDNINDQNGSDESLAAPISAFDLSTSKDYESRATKLSFINHVLPNYLYFMISIEWTQYI